MRFEFIVSVEVERVEGKFAGRDEIEDELLQALDGANPDSISGVGADSNSEYSVIEWDIQAQEKSNGKG